jgi:estrone sulfotransferase
MSSAGRIFKSHAVFAHTPWSHAAKYVVVCRNPADALVSYIKMKRSLDRENPTQSEFTQLFKTDYYIYGTWWRSVAGWWQQRDLPNVHFVFFEDLKWRFSQMLESLSSFLNVHLAPEELTLVEHRCSFAVMQGRPYFQPRHLGKTATPGKSSDFKFINEGKVGSAKEILGAEGRDEVATYCVCCRADYIRPFRSHQWLISFDSVPALLRP